MAKKVAKRKKRVGRKKAVRKKRGVKRKKSVSRKRVQKKKRGKKTGAPKPAPELPSEPIGRVSHYFSKAKAAAVVIERDGIRIGDLLFFKGHTSRFKQRVNSLQINHQTISQASSGDEVGILVQSRVREHDLVFKL